MLLKANKIMIGYNKEPIIIIKDGVYVNTERIIYNNKEVTLAIPRGFRSDGVTTTWFTRLFLSEEDIRKGINGAIAHDYMCKHKAKYTIKQSSQILKEQWVKDGLSNWKAHLIYIGTFCYQYIISKNKWLNNVNKKEK